MKSFKYNLIVVAALALFASCNKEKPSSGGTADGIGFVAKTEQGGSNSKTHGVIDGTSLVVKWTAYDKIKVAVEDDVAAEHQYTFELTEGEDNTSGTFYTGIPHPEESFFDESIHNYVAVYPAANRGDEANSITSANASSAVATFKLSDTQDYSEASFGEKASPMMAHSTDKTLQFKNIMGGLCFLLHGDAIVTKVELTTKADEALWGTCTATLSGIGGEATISNITTANTDPAHATTKKTVTLDCGSGVELNSTPKKFYIMLPPGTLGSGFTMTVKGKDETSGTERVLYSHDGSIGSKGTITRNSILKASNSVYLKKGAINVAFTINADGDKVYLSKGNLQYQAFTGIWRFGDNQYDFVGGTNTSGDTNFHGNVSESTNTSPTSSSSGWIDLFGWGTSGYKNIENDPLAVNFAPYSTSVELTAANTNNPYGYGPSFNISPDLTNTNYDWGVYNAISNGGNGANQWRTLTADEWDWILGTNHLTAVYSPVPGENCRTSSTVNGTDNARFAKATVNGIAGVILFPDNYMHPTGVTAPTSINIESALFTSNSYDGDPWTEMENAGCVFLPVTGIRTGNGVDLAGFAGYYWSSTHANSSEDGNARYAYRLYFVGDNLYTHINKPGRHLGLAVRLACDIP